MKKIVAKAGKTLPYLITIPTIPLVPQGTGITTIITNIAGWVLWIAGALALIYLIYGGIIYITAGGNEDRAKIGKSALLSAIVGLVIIALVYVIIRSVQYLLVTPKL